MPALSRSRIFRCGESLNGDRLSHDHGIFFVEDMLGKKVAIGTGLSVDSITCRRHVVPDVPTLARRLGDDYGCMHWDLIKVLYCQPCREASRDDNNLVFTNHAMTPDKRR